MTHDDRAEDYLWDPTAPADPSLVALERTLSVLAEPAPSGARGAAAEATPEATAGSVSARRAVSNDEYPPARLRPRWPLAAAPTVAVLAAAVALIAWGWHTGARDVRQARDEPILATPDPSASALVPSTMGNGSPSGTPARVGSAPTLATDRPWSKTAPKRPLVDAGRGGARGGLKDPFAGSKPGATPSGHVLDPFAPKP